METPAQDCKMLEMNLKLSDLCFLYLILQMEKPRASGSVALPSSLMEVMPTSTSHRCGNQLSHLEVGLTLCSQPGTSSSRPGLEPELSPLVLSFPISAVEDGLT